MHPEAPRGERADDEETPAEPIAQYPRRQTTTRGWRRTSATQTIRSPKRGRIRSDRRDPARARPLTRQLCPLGPCARRPRPHSRGQHLDEGSQ